MQIVSCKYIKAVTNLANEVIAFVVVALPRNHRRVYVLSARGLEEPAPRISRRIIGENRSWHFSSSQSQGCD